MIKVVGIALCTLFCAAIIKSYNKTFAIILSVIGIASIFFVVVNSVGDVFDSLLELSNNYKVSFHYVKLMLRVLGLTLIGQFVADLCRENGEIALSSIVIFVTKITILSLMLPLFEAVVDIVIGIVK